MADPYSDDPWAVNEPAPAPETPNEDPWAAEATYADPPRDEAQTSIPNTPAKKENSVNNGTSEGKIVTTVKYGSGFDAPWTVIHSDSVEEALNTLKSPAAKELFELTAKAAKFAKGLDAGTAPAAQRGNGNGGGQRQQQSTPPGVESKTCAHGEMVFRTGNGNKGPWKAFFCPQPKDAADQCKPVWVK